MNNTVATPPCLDPVPWTSRDSWLGLLLGIGAILAMSVVWMAVAPEALVYEPAAYVTVIEPLAIPVAWIFGPRKYHVGWSALGFRRARPNALTVACGFLVGFYIISCLNGLVVSSLFTPSTPAIVTAVAETQAPAWLLLASVVVAPISEEILFRGFAFAGLQARHGWKKAALVSSLAFAFIHLEPVGVIPLFAVGYLLSILYRHTNSLWPGIALHAVVNIIGVTAALLLLHLEGIPV
jgi:membrane protease YdiL (CAAX protease family)